MQIAKKYYENLGFDSLPNETYSKSVLVKIKDGRVQDCTPRAYGGGNETR